MLFVCLCVSVYGSDSGITAKVIRRFCYNLMLRVGLRMGRIHKLLVVIRSRGYGFRIQYDMQVFNVRSKNWRIASLVYHTKSETGRNDEKRKFKKPKCSQDSTSPLLSVLPEFLEILLAFFIQSPIAFHETAGELTYANRGMHYSGAIRWTPGSLLVEVRGKIRWI